jgi:xanthine dehydrogenase iron-sulfur cluster and FAD-binding subunit A
MMAAQALVERGDGNVEREEVIEALNGHLCRCTGYVKIVDAATAAVRGDTSPAHASADTDPQGDDAVTLLPGSPA